MNISPKKWNVVFERDMGYCQYCGADLLQKFSSFVCATVDHIKARSIKGSDDPNNLVLSCPGCNQLLSRKSELQTFESRKAYVNKVFVDRKNQLDNWRAKLRKENQ